MCGIVGYIGKRNAVSIGLDSLKRLEYRGYDSAGTAFWDAEAQVVRARKAIGRIANLEAKMDPGIWSHLAIAHTRWATHGEVSEANAHPHADCQGEVWVAHNGIIENYRALKKNLIERGHRFRSETDTEVIAHLIEVECAAGRPFPEAVRQALAKLRGTYGLAILSARHPDTLIAARNFSPLLLGIGRGEYFVASDAAAVIPHTTAVVYLEDGDIAVLKQNTHAIFDLGARRREREPAHLDWSPEEAERGGYPHFMQKEIFEGPEAVENSIRGRLLPALSLIHI